MNEGGATLVPSELHTRFGMELHYCTFSCGYYAVSSGSVSAATRLAYSYDICILIRTCADLTFLFLSEVYDLFNLLCVLSSVFICFPPEVTFRSRGIGACLVTTGCILAMS